MTRHTYSSHKCTHVLRNDQRTRLQSWNKAADIFNHVVRKNGCVFVYLCVADRRQPRLPLCPEWKVDETRLIGRINGLLWLPGLINTSHYSGVVWGGWRGGRERHCRRLGPRLFSTDSFSYSYWSYLSHNNTRTLNEHWSLQQWQVHTHTNTHIPPSSVCKALKLNSTHRFCKIWICDTERAALQC